MTNSTKSRVLIVLATLVFSSLGATRAQESPAATSVQEAVGELPAEEVGEKAARLLAEIGREVSAAQRYAAALATASPEDSLVLRLQVASLQERAMKQVRELAEVLMEQERTGSQPELRMQVENLYQALTPQVWSQIQRLRDQIDHVRARRSSAAIDERLSIEQEVAFLSMHLETIFELAVQHIEMLEQLGLDAGQAQQQLFETLNSRAEELSGRIDLALVRIDGLETRRSDAPDNADIPVLLLAAHKDLATNEASMATVLDIMDRFELSTAVYRAQLVTSTRDVTTGLLDQGVAARLLGQAWDSFSNWIENNGPPFVIKLLLFLAIMVAFRFASRVVRKATEKSLDATKLRISQLLRRMIITSLSNLVLFLGLLIALSQLGISLGPLLAGVGVAGFIVGFALQDSLANFAAGMMILIYRPYDVGDLVDVGGVFGKVDEMSVVSTSILTLDNQRIMVPNNKIWGDVIKNVTAQKTRRVDMTFGIAYSDDIPKAERVLQEIVDTHDKVLAEPEPVVRLHALGESSVDFVVRPWVAVADYWDVYWDVTRAVKMRFDAEEISIPFPQRDVHIYEEKRGSDANESHKPAGFGEAHPTGS